MKASNYNYPSGALWKHYRRLTQDNQPTNNYYNYEQDNQVLDLTAESVYINDEHLYILRLPDGHPIKVFKDNSSLT